MGFFDLVFGGVIFLCVFARMLRTSICRKICFDKIYLKNPAAILLYKYREKHIRFINWEVEGLMFKRILALILILCFMLTFAGCGKTETETIKPKG